MVGKKHVLALLRLSCAGLIHIVFRIGVVVHVWLGIVAVEDKVGIDVG
jgi:hypothetical protein